MRTVTFTSVLAGVASVLGIEPAAYTAALQAKALLAINRHIKTGWKFDFWPELTLVEQRAYRPFWDEVTQFDAGAQVYFADDGLYYQANTAPNNPQDGESPAAYPAKWTAVTDFRRYIALDQPGKTPIDEVEGLYSYDPRLRTERPARLPFTLSHEGVVPMAETYALVWIKFRMRVSQFTQTVFDPASAYAAGALVLPYEAFRQAAQELRLLVLSRRSWNSTRPSVATRSSPGLDAGLLSSAATVPSK